MNVLEYVQAAIREMFDFMNNLGLGTIPSSLMMFIRAFLPIDTLIEHYSNYIRMLAALGFIKLLSKMITLKPKQLRVMDGS